MSVKQGPGDVQRQVKVGNVLPAQTQQEGQCWKVRSQVGIRSGWDWREPEKQVGHKHGMTFSFVLEKNMEPLTNFKQRGNVYVQICNLEGNLSE